MWNRIKLNPIAAVASTMLFAGLVVAYAAPSLVTLNVLAQNVRDVSLMVLVVGLLLTLWRLFRRGS